jgi:hypothetical protein
MGLSVQKSPKIGTQKVPKLGHLTIYILTI